MCRNLRPHFPIVSRGFAIQIGFRIRGFYGLYGNVGVPYLSKVSLLGFVKVQFGTSICLSGFQACRILSVSRGQGRKLIVLQGLSSNVRHVVSYH